MYLKNVFLCIITGLSMYLLTSECGLFIGKEQRVESKGC